MGSCSFFSDSTSTCARVFTSEYEPIFTMHPFGSPSIASLSTLPAEKKVEKRGFLHCCYTFVELGSTAQHACVCWIDSNGYTLDIACLPCAGVGLETRLQVVWDQGCRWRKRQVSEQRQLHVVIVKWGAGLSVAEVLAWEKMILDEEMGDVCVGAPETEQGLPEEVRAWQRIFPVAQKTTALSQGGHWCNSAQGGVVSVLSLITRPPSTCARGGANLESEVTPHVDDSGAMLLVQRGDSTLAPCNLLLVQAGLRLQFVTGLMLAYGPRDLLQEVGSDIGPYLVDIGRDFHELAWLTAVPPSGPVIGKAFAQRWSHLPLHCASVDRLTHLVEWVLYEGAGSEEDNDQDRLCR
jgi:hypothetical protein